MQLRYRNHTHELHENLLAVSNESLRNAADIQYARRERWDIQGKLIGTSQSDLISKINALKSAYAGVATGDAVFLHNDGAEVHRLTDSASLGGVRVIRGPDFSADPRNYIGYVDYALTLEAVFPVTVIQLLEFDEILEFEGGGPAFEHLVPVAGLPQKQITHAATTFRVRQSGRAVGHFRYPFVPPPIWPADVKEVNPRVRRHTPKRHGNGLTEFAVEWEWLFESAFPLVGVPHTWPAT